MLYAPEAMKRLRRGLKMIVAAVALAVGVGLFFAACSPQLGARNRGSSLLEVEGSNNYSGGAFRNTVATRMGTSEDGSFGAVVDFFKGSSDRTPSQKLPTVPLAPESISGWDGLRVTWLGHSTCLIELDGRLILTDPMFSDRASPLAFLGPRRFESQLPIGAEDLPPIDAVLISHDHYDHLDYKSIVALKERTARFYVPLGVGAHLKAWGVEDEKIVELDWWEERAEGPLTFAATPARHFSGRGLRDRNRTQWASWVILGSEERLFFSGDSGYFEGFRKIGEKYGPFDLTMLESGAYNEAWADIHMMPEETVKAHVDLKGKMLLPIHWGKFNLSLHSWTEPIERLLSEADRKGVAVVAPLQGQRMAPSDPPEPARWWGKV
jgi:L-ascorbate metabolism protein UlaG (beta-lactamase superfamily)